MYLVSVIIPNYNNASFLKECISSVFNQTYQNIECIVVDDGSTDDSIEVLRLLKSKHPKLKYYIQENSGPSVARNNGLMHSTGEYIAFLDSDDYWEKDKIFNQITHLEKNNLDIVFSNYTPLVSGEKNNHNEAILKNYRDISPLDFFYTNPLVGSASNVLIKRAVYQKVGKWDSYLRAGEDTDYWFRCVLNNFKIGFINKFDVIIRSHENNARFDYSRMFYYQLILIDKWYQLLKKEGYQSNTKQFLNAFRAKLSKLRWYCIKMKRYDLALSTFFIGFHLFKFKFFNRLTTIQVIKTLSKLIKRNDF